MNASFSGFARTLVMLSCLIAVPALALFGAPVSKLFEPLIKADWPRQAQGFVQRLAARWTPQTSTAAAKKSPIVPVLDIEPAVDERAASFGSSPVPAALSGGEAAPAAYFPPTVMPSPHQAAVDPLAHEPAVQAAAPTSPGLSPAALADPFQAMQRRLRELGATYYLLETWGPGGEMYRFHCRVAIDGQGLATRHFEATADDPLIAIERVLGEVEPWVTAGRR